MESNSLVIIILSFFAYFAIGFLVGNWYTEKIKKIYFSDYGIFPSEASVGICGGLMVVGWLFFLPYELLTKFKNWRREN